MHDLAGADAGPVLVRRRQHSVRHQGGAPGHRPAPRAARAGRVRLLHRWAGGTCRQQRRGDLALRRRRVVQRLRVRLHRSRRRRSGPPCSAEPGQRPEELGGTSDGSYASGDREAATTDDGTYLRGAQVADSNGIVQFTTIFPGWYRGRTPHLHLKVHLNRETVLTTQLYVEDALADEVYGVAPYNGRAGRRTRNAGDGIFSEEAVLTVRKQSDGYLGLINLGVDV